MIDRRSAPVANAFPGSRHQLAAARLIHAQDLGNLHTGKVEGLTESVGGALFRGERLQQCQHGNPECFTDFRFDQRIGAAIIGTAAGGA